MKAFTGYVRNALIAGSIITLSSFGVSRAADTTATTANTARGQSGGATLTAAELVPTLHMINQMEIDAGKLAQDNGGMQAVKDYGKTLVRDHEAADKQLKDYADQAKLDVKATIPGRVDAQLKPAMSEMNALKDVKGAAFDRRFVRAMANDHRQAISLVNAAKAHLTDTNLTTLLGQIEPTLRAHEQMAANLLKQVGSVSSNQDQTGTTPTTTQGRRTPGTKP